jgi:hypothetical protein
MVRLTTPTPGQPNTSRDVADRPALKVARDFSQLEMRFNAQPNRAYVIESCERLGLGEWSTVRSIAPNPNGDEVVLRQLIEKAQPERYFRLRVLP